VTAMSTDTESNTNWRKRRGVIVKSAAEGCTG
jgi:hypothetical protein